MVDDQLSEVFDLVEVRGLISGAFAVRGPWVTRAVVPDSVKLVAVVCGRAHLTADGVDGTTTLEHGDVAIVNSPASFELRGGIGEGPRRTVVPDEAGSALPLMHADCGVDDVLVGGLVELNSVGRTLLQQALPRVAHVRAGEAAASGLRTCLDRIFAEARQRDRLGSGFAIRHYGRLLLLEVLRAHVEQSEPPPGWLRLLTDTQLRPALVLMHGEPGRLWRLDDLAHAASMSRTAFTGRFRRVAGVPPLTYLNHWRVLLAQRALRTGDLPVGSLAAELGYRSESAFSKAFKRDAGESPLRYRNRTRGELGAGPDTSRS